MSTQRCGRRSESGTPQSRTQHGPVSVHIIEGLLVIIAHKKLKNVPLLECPHFRGFPREKFHIDNYIS